MVAAGTARHPRGRRRLRRLRRAHPRWIATARAGRRPTVAARGAALHGGGHGSARRGRAAHRAGPDHLRDHPRVRLRPECRWDRAIPRQRLPSARLVSHGPAPRQGEDTQLRGTRAAAARSRPGAVTERPRPRLRPNRLGQDHHARSDDRCDQRRAPLPHPHH